MNPILTVAEAARNLAEVVDRALYQHETTTLVENGRPVARVVPAAASAQTGKEIAVRMTDASRPRLRPLEAETFEADLTAARAALPEPRDPWD